MQVGPTRGILPFFMAATVLAMAPQAQAQCRTCGKPAPAPNLKGIWDSNPAETRTATPGPAAVVSLTNRRAQPNNAAPDDLLPDVVDPVLEPEMKMDEGPHKHGAMGKKADDRHPKYRYSGSQYPYYHGRNYLMYPHYDQYHTPKSDIRRQIHGPCFWEWW